MRACWLMPLLALLLIAAAPPLPPELKDSSSSEGWIWQQVQKGKTADLNGRCNTPPLNLDDTADARWQAPCRRVRADLLRTLLTQPDLAVNAPHGVRIVGARIVSTLDLTDAHVGTAQLWLDSSWITGGILLTDARLEDRLSLDGTLIDGSLQAWRIRIAGELLMQGTRFQGPVSLTDGRVEGLMSMVGARVADQQAFRAERLHVGVGGLFLNNVNFGGPVDLIKARVEGSMSMDDAKAHEFNAEGVRIGDSLLLRRTIFDGSVSLRGAQIKGQMSMIGAKIADQRAFDAERLRVEADLFARDVLFGGPVNLKVLIVDGGLDLRDSHARRMDLGGAVIRDDLLLGGHGKWLRWDVCDVGGPRLNLRNAKVGNLQDDELAWPSGITLEGFTYARLGGIGGEQSQDLRNRAIDWWQSWLRRDPVYSAQPYAQLAGVLATAGNREGAADIRFYGRDRQRTDMARGCTWLQKLGLVEQPDGRPCGWDTLTGWLGLTALQTFVGYGIGGYNFRAFRCALVLTLVGTIVLCFAPGVRGVRPIRFMTKARRGPRQKSLLWCFGASLQRVLPLVTINQEFSDFFNDPKRERLHAWQHVAFAILGLCGWALGLFVVAAFSGLIQS